MGATIAQDAFLIAIAVMLAARIARPKAWHFGLRRTRFWPALGWAVAGFLSFVVLAIAYFQLVDQDVEQTTLDDLNAEHSTLATLAVAFLVVVVAPVAEEIFFRGFVFRSLRSSLTLWPAAIAAGLLFGLVHLPTGPEAVPMLAVLGVIFCLVYEKTGSLYPVIGLHAFNNTIAVGSELERWAVIGPVGGVMLIACMLAPRLIHPRRTAAAV